MDKINDYKKESLNKFLLITAIVLVIIAVVITILYIVVKIDINGWLADRVCFVLLLPK